MVLAANAFMSVNIRVTVIMRNREIRAEDMGSGSFKKRCAKTPQTAVGRRGDRRTEQREKRVISWNCSPKIEM